MGAYAPGRRGSKIIQNEHIIALSQHTVCPGVEKVPFLKYVVSN